MMLELFAARLEGRSVSQTRLGIAAAVPQTSALHVTRRMLERGVFTSAADPDDKRLVLIGLSDEAVERIGAYLAAGYGMTA
jgi:DNA-binding MarR family transcriptional regulator